MTNFSEGVTAQWSHLKIESYSPDLFLMQLLLLLLIDSYQMNNGPHKIGGLKLQVSLCIGIIGSS